MAIVGCSKDSPEAQKKWAEKHGLPFPLLSDPDGAVQDKYGVWWDKIMKGKRFTGTLRTTYIIGIDRKVEKVYSMVKVNRHVAQVLENL